MHACMERMFMAHGTDTAEERACVHDTPVLQKAGEGIVSV